MKIFELAKKVEHKKAKKLILSESIGLDKIDPLDKSEQTPLFRAISTGNVKETKKLLKKGATLHTDKYTPFLVACFYGQLEVAKILYTPDALKERDVYQNTPLMNAAWNEHTHIIKWLLHLGADCNALNIHGDTALLLALRHKNLESAWILLGEKEIHYRDRNVLSYDAMVIAVVQGFLDVAEAIYSSLVDLNKQYTENNTLLHMCAINGNLAATQWLLDKGADPRIKNSMGYTPLMIAAMHGHTAIVSKYLADKKYEKHSKKAHEMELAFLLATGRGHLDVVELIISHHKKYDESFLQAALLCATINNRWNVIAKILELHPSHKVKMINKHYDYGNFHYNQGNTLLHAAAEMGHLDIVINLAAMGAKLDGKNDNEDNLLHMAVKSDNVALVRWLCNQNVYTNHKNKQGNTPLHFAVELENQDMIRCLLLHGADVRIENKQKETPTFLSKAKPEVRACLKQFKERDFTHFGLGAAHQAVTSIEDKALLELLPINHDLNVKSKDGLTPIQLAAHLKNINPLVVCLLWSAKGDRKAAQELATQYCKQYDSHATAHQSFSAALHEIKTFPAHRLDALLRLVAVEEEKKQEHATFKESESSVITELKNKTKKRKSVLNFFTPMPTIEEEPEKTAEEAEKSEHTASV